MRRTMHNLAQHCSRIKQCCILLQHCSRLEFDHFRGDNRFYFSVESFRAVVQSATEINDPGDETYFYRQPCHREKLRLSCKYRGLARISFRVNVALNRSLTSALSGRSS